MLNIFQIFAEKPAVRQAYLKFVPGKVKVLSASGIDNSLDFNPIILWAFPAQKHAETDMHA